MAKRGWSLLDAQLERAEQRRDRYANRVARQQAGQTGLASAPTPDPKPVSRPSPDRLRERSDIRDPNYEMNRQGYNEMTYSQTDVADLRGATSGHPGATHRAQQGVRKPEHRGGYHPTNFGLRGQGVGNPGGLVRSTRQSVPETPKQSGYRRQRSTQEAYRAADASMFNSNVTPKAERVKDKRPRSRMSPDQNVFW